MKVLWKLKTITGLLLLAILPAAAQSTMELPEMYFSDSSASSVNPNAKDPQVISYKNHYYMYYSVPPSGGLPWRIGVAGSDDLIHWRKLGEVQPRHPYEQKGLCAAGALVKDNRVHLFYQTYGNGRHDAICHAVSTDAVHFKRDPSNPVFHPHGSWTCGRAIDAEVVSYRGRYWLYFATRDTSFKIQKVGVASCSLKAGFHRGDWTQMADSSVLAPRLPWEKDCIEAPSCIRRGNRLYMFYAGAYNNAPQQIGVAYSLDGIRWTRLSGTPFLANGAPGTWNQSESGHPCIFTDRGGTTWLFFQGNDTHGKTWFISKKKILWKNNVPYLSDQG